MENVIYAGRVYQSDIDDILQSGLSLRLDYEERVLDLAATELKHYYCVLAATADQLRGQFSEPERSFMVDVSNGIMLDDFTVVQMFNAELLDAEAAYGDKWGVNGQMIAAKVEALNLVERCALVDAIKMFWIKVSKGEHVEVSDLFDLDPENRAIALKSYIHVQM